MQAWMSTAFSDHLLAKTVPVWLYPHYTDQRANLLIPSVVTYELRQQSYTADRASNDLGLFNATIPLQGIEILTKKALAEAVLLASERAAGQQGMAITAIK